MPLKRKLRLATRSEAARLGRLNLIALGLVALVHLESTTAYAADKPYVRTTVTYKQLGHVKIEADVYHFADDQVRPVVGSLTSQETDQCRNGAR